MGYNNYSNRITSIDVREVATIPSNPTEPVTLDEAKNWLRIDTTADDTLITNLIISARRKAERYLNRDIVAKQREAYWTYVDEDINLPYTTNGVTSVSVDGNALTLNTDYEVLGLDNPKIRILNNPVEKVQINYTTANFSNSEIEIGILMLIEESYHGHKTMWKSILSPFKVFGYYGVR